MAKTISRCEFLVTLKFKDKVYLKGEVLYPPFSKDVLDEIAFNSEHIRIFAEEEPSVEKTSVTSVLPDDLSLSKKRIGKKRK